MDLRERTQNHRRHPWELARADFFCRLVRGGDPTHPVHVLDIGAGDVFFAETLLSTLPEGSSVTCVDPGYPATWLGERPAAGHRKLTLCREAPDAHFDRITLLDVLEHVDDDSALLSSAVSRLKPDGQIIVSVPAWQMLYTEHDTQLGHLRRYSPAELSSRLATAELRTHLQGGLFCSLLLPRSLAKLAEIARGHWASPRTDLEAQIQTSVGGWSGGPAVTAFLRTILSWDGRANLWLARRSMRVPGLSVWAVAGREA